MEDLIPALQTVELERVLESCNTRTARFGLVLSAEQVRDLAEGRQRALADTGRVEFGEGILPRLILAFCDSPYLHQADYAETLLALQEIFYQFKNRFQDRITDGRLLELMRRAFDRRVHGAAELLAGMTPAELLGKEPGDA